MQGSRWHKSKLLVNNKNCNFEIEMISSHTSRFAGIIDEVKLSTVALAPGAGFLWGP
jgi:hypothetical protein